MIEVLLLLIGLLVTCVSTMVGLAGGFLVVPMLVLGLGLQTQQAVGASLAMMTFATISATIAYARQGRINYKAGLLLDALDVPGALAGAWVTTLITSNLLAGLFGALLLVVAFYAIRGKNKQNTLKTGQQTTQQTKQQAGILGLPRRTLYVCLLASFASGGVAAMFGAGGGTVDETAMILVLGMPPHVAAGTSEFAMALTNSAALAPHAFLGNVALEYAFPLTVGAVVGAQIGPALSKRAKATTLKKILAAVFVLVGIRMLLVPWTGA